MSLVLHNYFRSSTSIRVRIALEWKGLEYEYKAYPLLEDAQNSDTYLFLNPQGLVPALQTPEGVLTQSLAILEYLDETHPEPPLMPDTPLARARVRALAHVVALDIHPLNNLRVLQYLRSEYDADADAVSRWFQNWARSGFAAVERLLKENNETGRFCCGDTVTIADICLVSQAVNNQRFDIATEDYPLIEKIVDECLTLSAFQNAMPDQQPDSV